MQRTLCQRIAETLSAIRNCERSNNAEWLAKHTETLDALCKLLPSGSGIDNGTHIDPERCTSTKLVFDTSFHHMNDGGMYDRWTEHTVTVTPEFGGISVNVSGRNRNDIKDYLGDVYHIALTQLVD